MAIKIIKEGKIKPEPVFVYTCNGCDTVFTYTKEDVYINLFGNEIVKCPLCKKPLDASWLFRKKYKGE